MTSTQVERPRRPLVAAFVNVGLGLSCLYIGLSHPSIANVRPVVIVSLLAAGACLGMGLMLVVNHVFHRKG
jgi:hypothetical protein